MDIAVQETRENKHLVDALKQGNRVHVMRQAPILGAKKFLPFGFNEFTQGFLKKHGVTSVKPINIPAGLQEYKYLKRNILFTDATKEDLMRYDFGKESYNERRVWSICPVNNIFSFYEEQIQVGWSNQKIWSIINALPDNERFFVIEKKLPYYFSSWDVVFDGNGYDVAPCNEFDWRCDRDAPSRDFVEDIVSKLKRPCVVTLWRLDDNGYSVDSTSEFITACCRICSPQSIIDAQRRMFEFALTGGNTIPSTQKT